MQRRVRKVHNWHVVATKLILSSLYGVKKVERRTKRIPISIRSGISIY